MTQLSFGFARSPPKKEEFVGIPRKVIEAFRNRKLDNYEVCKRLNAAQVEEMVKRLPVKPPIWKELYHDQKVCFLIGAMTKRFYFGNDMGTGKTMLSIALSLYFNKLGQNKRTLVVVPQRIHKDEWAEQFERHAPGVPYLVLEGTSKNKWKQLLADDKALFVVETYGGLIRMVGDSMIPKGKKKAELVLIRKDITKLQEQFQCLIMDEITFAKSKMTTSFRVLRFLSKAASFVFGLSGTPIGDDPEDLWSQFFLVDLGETLGETLGLFRAAFFTSAKRDFGGGRDYSFRKSMSKRLHRTMAHRFIRYLAKESDLPAVTNLRRVVMLPKTAEAYYQEARNALLANPGSFEAVKNAFLRARQISSGFIGYKDDENGTRAQIEFKDNPKLDALIDLVLSTDQKIVVFHDFIYSGERISRELAKEKIGHVRLWGGTKDPNMAVRQFQTDDRCQVLVLNNTIGSLGLDRIKVAQYGVYYESPVSRIMRRQADRRIRRQYSEHERVVMYDLIVKDTWDETILQWHEQGGDIFQAVIEGRVKL